MAESEDKWIDAVTKLIRLTQEGKLEWRSEQPPDYLRGDAGDFVNIVFRSSYNDWNLRLYKNIFKIELNESYRSMFSLGAAAKYPPWKMDSVVILEVVDDKGNAIWAFPNIPALKDLLATVAYYVADVKGLLDDLTGSGIQIKTRIPGEKAFPRKEPDESEP